MPIMLGSQPPRSCASFSEFHERVPGQTTGSLRISGTIYLPAAKLTLTGSGATYAVGSQVIVYQLVCTGSGNFNVDYNGPQAPPGRQLYLVE